MSVAAPKIQVGAPIAQKGGKLEMVHYEYPITWTPANGREITFNRRYSDFEALHAQLTNKYWYCIIPPIPAKESITQNMTAKVLPIVSSHADPSTGTSNTLTYRQSFLRRFLRRLAVHPEISHDTLLTEKFMATNGWDDALKNPVPVPAFLSTSWMGSLKSMMSAATAATAKVSGKGNANVFDMDEAGVAYTNAVEASGQNHPERIEYAKTSFFVSHLKKTFDRLETEMMKLTERRLAEGEALQQFGSTFRQLSLDESDMALRQSIDLVGAQSQSVALIRTQHAQAEIALVSALGFLVGTCGAVEETLERMVSAHEYRRQLDEKVNAVTAQLSKGVPPANQQALTNELGSVTKLRDDQTQELAAALPKFASDFIDFHTTRQNDTQELVRQIGKVEINAAEAMASELRKLEPSTSSP